MTSAKLADPCLQISGNVAVAFVGDCRMYWRCYDNHGILYMCAEGTYFHPKKSYCTADRSFCHIINNYEEHNIHDFLYKKELFL